MLYQLLIYIHRYLDVADVAYTLRDLETWLLSNLQRILDSSEDEAIEVANQIDADLIELGEGLINEATFRERLEGYQLARPFHIGFREQNEQAYIRNNHFNSTISYHVMFI